MVVPFRPERTPYMMLGNIATKTFAKQKGELRFDGNDEAN